MERGRRGDKSNPHHLDCCTGEGDGQGAIGSGREDALQAAQEAVRICAGLVARWPQAFMENFRISVRNLVERVEESDGEPQRDPVVLEAMELLERLEAAGPGEDEGDRPGDAAK